MKLKLACPMTNDDTGDPSIWPLDWCIFYRKFDNFRKKNAHLNFSRDA